jgi:hypothetical protein
MYVQTELGSVFCILTVLSWLKVEVCSMCHRLLPGALKHQRTSL